MWVVFRKSDKQIVGRSAHGAIELEKAKAIAEIAKGKGSVSEFDAVQIRDPELVSKVRDPDNRKHVVISEKPDGGLELTVERPEVFQLTLATNVKTVHPVDGVPLLPADGKSIIEVTIQKIDQDQKPVARAEDDDQLFLRTDYGRLLSTGGEPVYHVKLSRGEGAFRLQAGSEARLATVRVFNGDPNLEDASIEIEFVPPGAVPVEEIQATFGVSKRIEPIGTVGAEARFGVTEVSGIGGKMGRQLASHGVSTVGDLLAAEPARLAEVLGTSAKRIEKFTELGRTLLEPQTAD